MAFKFAENVSNQLFQRIYYLISFLGHYIGLNAAIVEMKRDMTVNLKFPMVSTDPTSKHFYFFLTFQKIHKIVWILNFQNQIQKIRTSGLSFKMFGNKKVCKFVTTWENCQIGVGNK